MLFCRRICTDICPDHVWHVNHKTSSAVHARRIDYALSSARNASAFPVLGILQFNGCHTAEYVRPEVRKLTPDNVSEAVFCAIWNAAPAGASHSPAELVSKAVRDGRWDDADVPTRGTRYCCSVTGCGRSHVPPSLCAGSTILFGGLKNSAPLATSTAAGTSTALSGTLLPDIRP